MKILHVINNLTSGGAEKMVLELIRLQHKNQLRADILVLNEKNAVYNSSDLPGTCRMWISKTGSGNFNIRHFFCIKRHIRDYDIIHVHLFPSQYWVALALAATREKPPVITTEHSTFNRRMKFPVLRAIERWVFSAFDKIVAISPATKSALQQWLGMEDGRLITISNGISLELYKNALPYEDLSEISLNLQKGDHLLIMTGRFSEAKDHMTLLKALRLLPERYKLLLVGEGILQQACEAYCDRENIRNRVIFLGFRKDVPRLLKTCSISILSSHWEGFGLSAVEAMAAGIPVIASDVPGLKEIVAQAGVLFEAGNEKDLAAKILHLTADISHREAITAAQDARAAMYTMENTFKEYLSVYKEMVSAR